MEKHYNLTDNEFEKEFSDCSLNEKLFSHEAHLRLAWVYLDRYGLDATIKNICEQLQKYVKAVGAADKYNKTLTIAAIKAVHHFRQRSDSNRFIDFITEFPRLKFNFKDLIGAHYKFDIYNSPDAKKEYLKPDLLPFT
jgi:hypothetical protein